MLSVNVTPDASISVDIFEIIMFIKFVWLIYKPLPRNNDELLIYPDISFCESG